jgi:predicted nicotinamide N-methyase
MTEESTSSTPLVIAGHPAVVTEFVHGSTRIELYEVADLASLVDRDALLRDDLVLEPPYWAHLWIGAKALARRLAESTDLAGKRLLDLGCGLGLPGLVAAAAGAEVWFADKEGAALEFAARSAERNGFGGVRLRTIDFTRDVLETRFDVIVCAELVYEPASYTPLCEFLDRHLAPGGEIELTDAFRSDARTFFAELERRRFAGAQRRAREWEDGRPHPLFLWTFRRSG